MKRIQAAPGADAGAAVHREWLPGRVLLLAEPVEHAPSLALGVWVRSGSRHEQRHEHGLAHFIEHMVFKGTRRHSAYQLAKRMEAIGGQIDAFTTKETTCFYARVFDGHHAEACDILSELLVEATFEPDLVVREREVVEEEIQSYEDNPEEKILDLANEVVFGRHPLGHPILGDEKSLRHTGAREVRAFHRAHYTRPNLIVTAAGRCQIDELRAEILARFRLPARPAPRRRPRLSLRAPSERHEIKELQQSSLCLVRTAPSAQSPARHAEVVLNTILGAGMSSRLFQRIREDQGLAYTVYSFLDHYRDTGMFGIYVACQPGKLKRTLRLLLRELERISLRGVKGWELESAKAQLLTGLFLGQESMYERIHRLAYNELYYDRQVPIQEAVRHIERITADDVQRAARRLLRPRAFSLVTLGPAAGDRPSLADLVRS